MSIRKSVQTLDQSLWDSMPGGFGGAMMQEIIQKSMLTAGTGVNAAAFTDGRALGYESLDPVLQTVTLAKEDCVLWQDISKKPVHATVDQYNRQTTRGSRWGLAVAEATTPQVQLGDIARQYEEMAYYRDLRQVTHVMSIVNNTENPMALQERDGLVNVIQGMEFDMFWSVRTAIPTKVNGFFEKIRANGTSSVVYDMAGAKLTTRTPINQIAAKVRNKGGRPTHLYMNPLLVEDFSLIYETAARIDIPGAGDSPLYDNGDLAGIRCNSAGGRILFRPAPFNEVGWACPSVAQGNTLAPSVPASVSGAAGSSGGAIPAGDYYYKVTAVNENGESVAATSAAVTVTAGQKVTLTIADPASGYEATGFYIYRSAKDAASAADCRYLWQVAATLGVGGTSFVDDGTWVPGTSHIAVADMRPEAHTMQWSQLFPASKLPLARVGPYEQFLVMLYGAFRMSAPHWNAIIKNVLPASVLAEGWDPLGVYAE
jgi:hypothetical protein